MQPAPPWPALIHWWQLSASGLFPLWELKLGAYSRLSPQDRSPSLNLLSLFLPFIFFPTSFRREWAAFLCACCPLPVFRSCFVEVTQHSNDLLMNFFGGGESGLHVLFLCHLGTACDDRFYRKWMSNFIRQFSACVEIIMWFLPFILLMWYIIFIELCTLFNIGFK